MIKFMKDDAPRLNAMRRLLWRLVFFMLRRTHAKHFKGGRFGCDLPLMFVLGATFLARVENKPATASKLAHFLDMPRETVRRHLQELVRRGLVKQDGEYKILLDKTAQGENVTAISESVIEASDKLKDLLQ
jgi:DNA-binding transcriptional ArsR family regulator